MKINNKLFILPLVIALILTASVTVSPLVGVSKALATTTLGNAVNGDILSGKTATTDAGPITGTITNRSGSFNQTIWSNGNADSGVDYVVPAGYYDGNTQIWAVDGNLNSSNIKAGTSIFGVPGKSSVVDTGDANATTGQILSGYTAYVNGSKISGTIPITNPSYGDQMNALGATAGGYSGDGQTYAYLQIPNGTYLNNVNWVRSAQPNLVSGNIKAGVSIFGVTGTYTGPSHGSQQWTTTGTYSFTVPSGVYSVTVIATGGGGGGGPRGNNYGGGGGGGGGTTIQSYAVTPGQVLTVTIGLGGSASYTYGVGGQNGGNSSVDSIIGYGGGGGSSATSGGPGYGGYGGYGGGTGVSGTSGGYNGGTGGIGLGYYGQGGGGANGYSGGGESSGRNGIVSIVW